MGDCYIVRRGGGAVKGSKVINVSGASALPSNAENGTIAVVSATAVKNVYVQDAAPSSPQKGDLWFTQGNGAIIYVLGGVSVQVNTSSQYNGSSWVVVSVYQKMESGWLSNKLYLMNGSDRAIDITGGWRTQGYYGGTATDHGSYYRIVPANQGNQVAAIQTENKIDLTNYSKLYFHGNVEAVSGVTLDWYRRCGIMSAVLSSASTGAPSSNAGSFAASAITPHANGEYTISLDISTYSGTYYVAQVSSDTVQIDQIWMEV